MTVSIIIPVYNSEATLDRCLQCFFVHQNSDFEIIVVNDASPGPCRDIVSKYISSGHTIKYTEHSENKGVYNSRQSGFKIATGDYIGFVDSDDYVDPLMFLKLYKAAIKHDAEIAECGINKIQPDNSIVKKKIKSIYLKNYDIFAGLYNLKSHYKLEYHEIWNKIYSKKLWERTENDFPLLGPDNDGCEDLIRVSLMYYYARTYVSIPDRLYFYNAQNSNSHSKSVYPDKVKRYILGISSCITALKNVIEKNNEKRFTIEDLIKHRLWLDIFSLFIRINNIPLMNDRYITMRLFFEKIGKYFCLALLDKTTNASPEINDSIYNAVNHLISDRIIDDVLLSYILGLTKNTIEKNRISNHSLKSKIYDFIKN